MVSYVLVRPHSTLCISSLRVQCAEVCLLWIWKPVGPVVLTLIQHMSKYARKRAGKYYNKTVKDSYLLKPLEKWGKQVLLLAQHWVTWYSGKQPESSSIHPCLYPKGLHRWAILKKLTAQATLYHHLTTIHFFFSFFFIGVAGLNVWERLRKLWLVPGIHQLFCFELPHWQCCPCELSICMFRQYIGFKYADCVEGCTTSI